MRFAYIDSQGNEVTIPSVDALALRIELGAIGPDTELYDAQADRWGPAQTHEIFHTLSRDAGGDTFLVPSPSRTGEPEGPEPVAEESGGTEPELPEKGSQDVPPVPGAASLGLTLNPPEPVVDPSEGPGAADTDSGASGTGFDAPGTAPAASEGMTFDLTDDLSGQAGARGTRAEDEPPLAYDSGFSHGGFELEPSMDFTAPANPAEPDRLDLETNMDFMGPPADSMGPAESERLDLEPPMSAFDAAGPPAWMEQDGPAGQEGAMDFSRPPMDAELAGPPLPAPGSPPVVPGRSPAGPSAPRRRGPPPKRRTRRRGGGGRWLLGAATLAVLAVGGYYGWRELGDRLRPPPPRPPVVLPAIPPELEGPMRALAEDALPAMYAEIESQVLDAVPEEPSPDWLAGVYLGNASRFTGVEVFWNGIATFAERLGELETEAFHAEYLALADSAGFDGAERALMVARADSGFIATREERLGSYRLLGRLADASLALHRFLVENEASIAYTPATAFSGNPVEEAVPATEELGDRMWALVEDITNALDALGTLDRVTRERLSTVLFVRIDAIGIR